MDGIHRQSGAMRSVFWLLGLAALAVALALLVGHNRAVVSLFWPPYRFDVSFNFVLLCLVLGFVLLYLAMRAVAMLRELPRQARRWRSLQMERTAVGAVMDALAHQLAGRFVRAQAAGLSALEQLNAEPAAQWPRRGQLQLLAHLLVAEAAQSLQNRSARDEHLQAALHPKLAKASPEAREGALLRAVRWAVEDRDLQAARGHLAELYDFYGAETGVRVARKHISWYTRGLAGSAHFRHAMNQLPTIGAQLAAVDAFFLGLAAQNDRLYTIEELAA